MKVPHTKEELERNIARVFGRPLPPMQRRLPVVIDMNGEELL
jgi:hypothetical protein